MRHFFLQLCKFFIGLIYSDFLSFQNIVPHRFLAIVRSTLSFFYHYLCTQIEPQQLANCTNFAQTVQGVALFKIIPHRGDNKSLDVCG